MTTVQKSVSFMLDCQQAALISQFLDLPLGPCVKAAEEFRVFKINALLQMTLLPEEQCQISACIDGERKKQVKKLLTLAWNHGENDESDVDTCPNI